MLKKLTITLGVVLVSAPLFGHAGSHGGLDGQETLAHLIAQHWLWILAPVVVLSLFRTRKLAGFLKLARKPFPGNPSE